MRLDELCTFLKAEKLNEVIREKLQIHSFIASDLMSDVLRDGRTRDILVTNLTNQQTVRTAEMTDILIICYVNGKMPKDDTVNLAVRKRILLLRTDIPMAEACGRLFNYGLET